MPCVYAGMTGLDPDLRLDNHKAGVHSKRYVVELGLHLPPERYELCNLLTFEEAYSLKLELRIDGR